MKGIGDMTLYKGKLGNIQLIMWDALPDCVNACTIYTSCPYVGGERQRNKCEMRRRYLESIMTSLDNAVKEKDEISVLTIGLMIVPLFQHLINFKIFETTLSHTLMARTKIHPVYKEIRQTIKEINTLLKDLGVTAGEKNKGYLNGDSNYYDDLIRKGQVAS